MSRPTILNKDRTGRIVILSGPSGSGKTTLHKALLESPKLKGKLVKSISATTRARRLGEKDGRDYLFLDEKTFARRIMRGYFLEWEKVFDHYYGTPGRQVLNLLKKGKHVLLCIDVKGAAETSQQFPQAIKIFIKPPSMKELQKRLQRRASENHDSLKIRLEVAKEELKKAKDYDHVIINGSLEKAKVDLQDLVARLILSKG
ncbi:MAG: guanylate kinase [Candidatus Omnitrophica bacterium]|nr:guanylate kinase [Candidatus Omnitrophota bacterium]